LTQACNVGAEQPILAVIDSMAARRELCFDRCSATIRIALALTSGGKGFLGKFILLLTPVSQMLESPANPGRFTRIRIAV